MRRCNQCWRKQPIVEFTGRIPGHLYQDCATCRAKGKSPVTDHRKGLPTASPLRVTIAERSKNSKLGPIPSVAVTASTCPPSCSHFNAGCFGESHILRNKWRDVERVGVGWTDLCRFVAQLPHGQLWRYAEVGDLPGIAGEVDRIALSALVDANHGKRGFGFTHKWPTWAGLCAALDATRYGLTINLSADNLAQADDLSQYGPVAVVLPVDAPNELRTPEGRRVVVCAAERDSSINCSRCGLCARTTGRSIIGFIAHGLRKREVSERARLAVAL